MLKPPTRIVIPSIGAVFSHRLRISQRFWRLAGGEFVGWLRSSTMEQQQAPQFQSLWHGQLLANSTGWLRGKCPANPGPRQLGTGEHCRAISCSRYCGVVRENVELFNTFKCPKDNMFNLRSLNMRGPKTALRRPDQNFVCPRPDYRIMEILKLEKWSLRYI